MTKTIVNLTLPVVVKAVEEVLSSYPDHPHQQAFSIPDLRQKLIAFVLSRTRSLYTVVEEPEAANVNWEAVCCSLEQQIRIEDLVHQGIHQILADQGEWANHHIPQPCYPAGAPSSWFG